MKISCFKEEEFTKMSYSPSNCSIVQLKRWKDRAVGNQFDDRVTQPRWKVKRLWKRFFRALKRDTVRCRSLTQRLANGTGWKSITGTRGIVSASRWFSATWTRCFPIFDVFFLDRIGTEEKGDAFLKRTIDRLRWKSIARNRKWKRARYLSPLIKPVEYDESEIMSIKRINSS